MPDEHDYSVCEVAEDGKHRPRIALVQDQELIDMDYLTLECGECHQTTGYAVDYLTDVDWG
jgi:hypothetical protein